ncbi:hypothetical protein [Gordonia soli]|uniref:hypothetical protein n=1 Tax=Gordonia soli TaxID=320799 RepID=UPI000345EECE|nr:hypothetical protein [Gordonia soli]
MQIGDESVDFERFAESVAWLSADLRSCGLEPGQRIGLGVRTGWSFVLTLHALLALEVVIAPLDLCDDDAVARAGELDLDFLLAHDDHDDVLEDVVEEVADGAAVPIYRIADTFSLVDVGPGVEDGASGGGLINDLRSGRVEAVEEIIDEAARLGRRLGLWPGTRVELTGPLNERPAVLMVLACALTGACACVDGTRATITTRIPDELDLPRHQRLLSVS